MARSSTYCVCKQMKASDETGKVSENLNTLGESYRLTNAIHRITNRLANLFIPNDWFHVYCQPCPLLCCWSHTSEAMLVRDDGVPRHEIARKNKGEGQRHCRADPSLTPQVGCFSYFFAKEFLYTYMGFLNTWELWVGVGAF